MSIYEFRCVQAGWRKANCAPEEKTPPILTPDQFDAILAKNAETPEPTRVLTPEEVVSRFKSNEA
jgi:hypothetical protein